MVNKAIDDLVKALTETSEMGEHELNSLLKLLSIENPATLPEGHKLSDDSTLILQAIRELGEEFHHNNMPRKRVFAPFDSSVKEVKLPNGQKVKVGDLLFDMKNGIEVGEIVEVADEYIVLKNRVGELDKIMLDSLNSRDWIVMYS